MIKDLEGKMYEEKLSSLGLFRQNKGKLREELIMTCSSTQVEKRGRWGIKK